MSDRDFATTRRVYTQRTEQVVNSGMDLKEKLEALGLTAEAQIELLSVIEDYAMDVAYQHRGWDRVEKHPDFDGDYSDHWFQSGE